jgi:hypothetical protein
LELLGCRHCIADDFKSVPHCSIPLSRMFDRGCGLKWSTVCFFDACIHEFLRRMHLGERQVGRVLLVNCKEKDDQIGRTQENAKQKLNNKFS